MLKRCTSAAGNRGFGRVRERDVGHAALWGTLDVWHRYICYAHRDPRNDEIFYIGQGTHGRALNLFSVERSVAHTSFAQELIFEHGFHLKDVVQITAFDLTKAEAEEREVEELAKFISLHKAPPRFNLVVPKKQEARYVPNRQHDVIVANELSEAEKACISEALAKSRTMTGAARRLGIGRSTLYRHMAALGLSSRLGRQLQTAV